MAILPIQLKVSGISQADQLDKKLGSLEKQTKNVSTATTKNTAINKTATSSVVGYTASVVGLVGGIVALNKAYDAVITTGLNYNKEIEQQTASIKTLLGATSQNIDSLGNLLTAQEKYTLAQKEAVSTMKELEAINANTPNTLGETAKIYKSMLPSMRAVGATQKDLITLTEKLSIASGAAGIEFQSLLAGVDGLATGTVLANSDLGRFLSSIGLTNDVLKESDNVTKTLIDTLSGFEVLDTIEVATSNLNVQWQSLTGTLTQDIFVAQKESIKELTTLLKGLDQSTINETQKSVNALASSMVGGLTNIAFFIQDIRGTFLDVEMGLKQAFNFIELGIDGITLGFTEMLKDIEDLINSAFSAVGIDNISLVDKFAIPELQDQMITTQILIGETANEWKKQEETLRQQSIIVGQTANKFQEILTTSKELTNETVKSGGSLVANKSQGLNSSLQVLDADDEFDDEINSTIDSISEDIEPIEFSFTITGYDEVTNAIADITKASVKYYKDDEKLKKKNSKLNSKYEKDIEKAKLEGLDTSKITAKFNADQDALKTERTEAELAGYSALAGAMAGAYEQGSAGAIAFTTLQSALGIASSWTAIANAWALPFPSNIPAVATVTANVLPIIAQLSASGGGGGAGGGTTSIVDVSAGGRGVPTGRDEIEESFEPVTDRLDRQIELLESLNFAGTAGQTSIELGEQTFIKEFKLAIEDVKDEMTKGMTEVWNKEFYFASGRTAGLPEYGSAPKLQQLEDRLNEFTDSYIDILSNNQGRVDINGRIGEFAYANKNVLNESGRSLEEFTFKTIDFLQAVQQSETYEFFGGIDNWENAVNSIQKSLGTWTTSILEISNELFDASETLQDLYDGITGTDFYKDIRLNKAFADFDKLRGESGYAEYLQEQIGLIEKLEGEFDTGLIELLLSTDVNDLQAQAEAIKALSDASGKTFIGGAADVLDYLESIEAVSDAMETSRENRKEYLDSFKNETELTRDMADALGVGLAGSFEELHALFNLLSDDTEGLTNKELDLLDANRDLIESFADLSDSIQGIIDSIRGISATNTATNYNEALAGARGAIESGDTGLLEKYINTLSDTARLNSKDFANQSSYVFAQSKRLSELANLQAVLAEKRLNGYTSTNSELAINQPLFGGLQGNNVDNVTPATVATNVSDNNDINMAILERLDNMDNTLNRVTEGGNMMNVRLQA